MQGIYSNQQRVMFKNNEFCIDFCQFNQQDSQMQSEQLVRVCMTSDVAMNLRNVLDSVIDQFTEACLKKKQKPKESEKPGKG